jgi:peptidoglycan/LPS O-acetylase OafA/YrhL
MLSISLEVARGLAALWVFVYHMRLGIEPGPLRRLADAGFLGVPAFFVISGYCMMASSRGILARGHSAGTFLRRRLRRIYPPFWGSILVILAVPFIDASLRTVRGPFHWPAPRWYALTPADWVALVTLAKGLFWVGPAHKPWAAVNPVYWSLAIEVQFYLVVAVALVLRRGFHTVLAVVTLGCLAFWRFGPPAPGVFPQYWPMFALGLLLYWVLEKDLRPARLFGAWTVPVSAALGALLLAAALGLTMYAPSLSLPRQTLFALFCCLIFWTCSGLEPAVPQQALPSRALTGLGKMSYSLYLLHIHLVSFVTMAVWPLIPRARMFALVIQISGTLALTYVFYRYCEKRYITTRR